MVSWPRMVRFLTYGLAGSLAEAAFTSAVASAGSGRVTVRGPSTPMMVGLYGLALPLFEPLHDSLRGRPTWQRGVVYAAGTMTIEAVAGLAWRRMAGRVPWEYRSALSIAGVTRLDYAPAWALVGLVAERVHDALTGRKEGAVRGSRRATLRAG
jgi:hypothetical protein